MKTWKGWTATEEATLERLRLDRLSLRQIAARLGRTRASVKTRLQRIGCVKPARLLCADLLEPHGLRDLAHAHGVSYGAVRSAKKRLRRAGVACPRATPRPGGQT